MGQLFDANFNSKQHYQYSQIIKFSILDTYTETKLPIILKSNDQEEVSQIPILPSYTNQSIEQNN